MAKKDKIVIPIGDPHLPYHSQGCLNWIVDEFMLGVNRNPYAIVVMGDLNDYVSFCRFPKRILLTPHQEMTIAREEGEKLFRRLRKRNPKSKIFLIKGNHDERLAKYIISNGGELEHLVNYSDYWDFDGVTTIHDPKEVLTIDGIDYIHGHTGFGMHSKQLNYPDGTVIGHLHIGATQWFNVGKKSTSKLGTHFVFEHCCGFIGNPFHENLIYRPMNKYFKWTLGVSKIEDRSPKFYPYPGRL